MGASLSLSSIFSTESPYRGTPWRRPSFQESPDMFCFKNRPFQSVQRIMVPSYLLPQLPPRPIHKRPLLTPITTHTFITPSPSQLMIIRPTVLSILQETTSTKI